MEKEQLFKVLDALELSPDLVQEYYQKIIRQSALDVVYRHKNGSLEITKEIKKNLTIVGYVLEDIVIFSIPYNGHCSDSLTVGEIKQMGTYRHHKARPIGLQEIRIMKNNAYAFNETIANLGHNGYKNINYWRTWFIPIDDTMSDDKTVGNMCDITGFFDGASKLGHFANKLGSFYYFCKLDEL